MAMESHWKVSKIIFNYFNFIFNFIFQDSFKFTIKLGRRHRNFLYNLWSSSHAQCLPLSTSPIRVVHLFTTDGPTLTYYYPLKSIIYVRVHLWYYTFCGFGKMCNDMYSPLYYAEYFDCLKNPPCLTYSPLFPFSSDTHH